MSQLRETVLRGPHLGADGVVAFLDGENVPRVLIFEVAMQAMEGEATLEVYRRAGRDLPMSRHVNIDMLGDPAGHRGARAALDWLLAHGEECGGGLIWRHLFDLHVPGRGTLAAPWASAFSQACAVQALLLWNRHHPEVISAEFVRRACVPFLDQRAGLLSILPSGAVWFQEYPFSRPTFVLNAHFLSLAVLARVARQFGDPHLHEQVRRGRAALIERMPLFDRGCWTRYDLESQGWLMLRLRARAGAGDVLIGDVTLRTGDGAVIGEWSSRDFEESVSYTGPFQGADWHAKPGDGAKRLVLPADGASDNYLFIQQLGVDAGRLFGGLQIDLQTESPTVVEVEARDPRTEALCFVPLRSPPRPLAGALRIELDWAEIGPPLPVHYHLHHALVCEELSRLLDDAELDGLARRFFEQLVAAAGAMSASVDALLAALRVSHRARRSERAAAEEQRHSALERISELEIGLRSAEASRIAAERAMEVQRRALAVKEEARDQAEKAYAALQEEHRILREQYASVSGELAIRRGVRGGLREVARSLKRAVIGEALPLPCVAFTPPWKVISHDAAGVRPIGHAGRPLRVLLLSHMFPHPDQPTSGPFVHEQVRALREHEGIDARVLVGRPFWMTFRHPAKLWRANRCWRQFHQHCPWVELEGVPVRYLPYRIFGPWLTQGWSYRRTMLDGIDELRRTFAFDVVHAHTGYLDGSAGLAISQKFRVPLVVTEHTGPFSLLMRNPVVRRWTLRSLQGAAVVIAVSTAQQRAVAAHLAPADERRVVVVPNVVDVNAFFPPAEWKPDPRAPRFMFVGYFVPIKRLPMLLSAFRRVLERIDGATLTLVGGGENREQEQAVEMDVRLLGLERSVRICGYRPRAEVARMMREECDVLVLSSEAETFGCVVIEAMASGKPVVSTRCGGPEDVIVEDSLGRLCDNDRSDALAAAMLDAADHLRDFDPQRIRAYAVEHFSDHVVARRLRELYEAQLGGRVAGSRPAAALVGTAAG